MTISYRQLSRFHAPASLLLAASIATLVWLPAPTALARPAHHGTTAQPTPTSYALFTSAPKVKSTRGVMRRESIFAFKSAPSDPASIELLLERNTGGSVTMPLSQRMAVGKGVVSRDKNGLAQAALNLWDFRNLLPSDFSIKGGNATLRFTSAQVGPFGRLYGTFTHTSQTKQTCNVSGSEYKYSGAFKVNELFKTKNRLEHRSKLGWVHGPTGHGGTISFPNKKSNETTLIVDNNCVNASPPPPTEKTYCETGTSWAAPYLNRPNTEVSLYGDNSIFHSSHPSSFNQVSATRSVSFTGLPAMGGYAATPVELGRFDSVVDNVPRQTYRQNSASPFAQTETITAPATDKYMQGKAVLDSAASATATNAETCYAGNTPETQVNQNGTAPFSWINGPTRLQAHSVVGGNISLGNKAGNDTGSIDHYTYHP